MTPLSLNNTKFHVGHLDRKLLKSNNPPKLTRFICKRFAGMVRFPDSIRADIPGQKMLGERDGVEKEAETPVTSVTKNVNAFRALPRFRVFHTYTNTIYTYIGG